MSGWQNPDRLGHFWVGPQGGDGDSASCFGCGIPLTDVRYTDDAPPCPNRKSREDWQAHHDAMFARLNALDRPIPEPELPTAEQVERANTYSMLMQLIADLYDPNDCDTEGMDSTCFEHNHWNPVDNGGRDCPHARARRLLRGAR